MSSENPQPPEKETFGDRLAVAFLAFIRALITLLVIVLVLGLIAVAVIYGGPALYRQYVAPIQNNLTQLQNSQAQQDQTNQQLSQRMDSLQSRITDLEGQRDADKQALDELKVQITSLASTQQADQQAWQGTLSAGSSQFNQLTSRLAALETQSADLQQKLTSTDNNLSEIATAMQSDNLPVAVLRRELQLVKAMEYLTRARISLIANNLGSAQSDIQAAHDQLIALESLVPDYQTSALQAIVKRLELALGNLPNSPVLASDDLEIAWQLLQKGLPEEAGLTPAPTSTGTLTPAAQLSGPGTQATPTPTPAVPQSPANNLTPTPTPTPGVTATPNA
jgi:septal ring factor EnvC (AmiA/AmiB activator)